MADPFVLPDVAAVKIFLGGFPGFARRAGELLFNHGAVQELEVEQGGYAASVVDREGEQEVQVKYEPGAKGAASHGWVGRCTCKQRTGCAHLFAVMQALLAEHSSAVVRSLSAGEKLPATGSGDYSARGDLRQQLIEALGRPLKTAEEKYLVKLQSVFSRVKSARNITHWDFDDLGLSLGGYGWESLRIWPQLPKDLFEFWQYVANAAAESKVSIPAFMEPVTDLKRIRAQVARWQRAKEVERWKHWLSEVSEGLEPVEHAVSGETDLRFVVGEDELSVEYLEPGASTFHPLGSPEFLQFSRRIARGALSFTSEGEWIWKTVENRIGVSGSPKWRYSDASALSTLAQICRSRLVRDRLVTPKGQPLARPTDPLRWELRPASNADDDYRLKLVRSDGQPLPKILAVLPGDQTIFLTANSVLYGPTGRLAQLNPQEETSIPAPALERREGVAFLRNLGLELPERIKERLRRLPYAIVVNCSLRPVGSNPDAEECQVLAEARAEDGRRMTWTGSGWVDSTPRGVLRKMDKKDGSIPDYDQKSVSQAGDWLAALPVKPSWNDSGLVLRVNRRFPELFAPWLIAAPPGVQLHLEGELASFLEGDVAGRVKLEVTEAEIDWFDLRVVLDVEDTTLSSEELQFLLKAKGEFVRLSGKGWRRLKFDLSPEDDEHLAKLGLSASEFSAEPQRLHALQLSDDAAKRLLPADQIDQIQRRASEIRARVAPPLPTGVTAELRPYQMEGFHFLAYLAANRFGGILADDMGLGKTLQTLTWLLWLREEAQSALSQTAPSETGGGTVSDPGSASDPASTPSPIRTVPASLVVCPKSVVDNWRAEAARFTPALRVKVWSAAEMGNFLQELSGADLHVLNYAQLRGLGEGLGAYSFLAVVLDEGQYIKNPNSQTAQVARSVRAAHRLVLSGTPIENRLLDLWSLMAFAMPGILSSRAYFGRLYDAKGDPLARRRLAARVRPFLLRRTKGQVAKDLPDRVEEDLFCELEGEQKLLYRAELKRAQQILLKIQTQKQLAGQQFHFLVSMLRLRQICCDPRLHDGASKAPSAKVEALIEQLEPLMEEGQKVLIFSQFVEMLNLLRPDLEARGWRTFYLAGETENRGALVEQFQAAEGAGVFLISLKAGGFGLNLTAASYVVLFDPWWNPAVESQAIDRTHRIGQVNKVIAYRLLIKNSIEEKIRQLQKRKQLLVEDVLGEERFAQGLTLDDLKFLFSDDFD